jgi:Domain of unknown function (DUF222)
MIEKASVGTARKSDENSPEISLANIPLERIETEICELAAHISAATYRMLLLLAEFDRRKGWFEWGCKSCVQWLTWRCGMSSGAARDHLRVAHRLGGMPLIASAFAAGELSYSKARALSRIVTPENEETLRDWARNSTAADLERLSRAYRRAISSDQDERERFERRRLTSMEAEDGTVIIRARLMPEDAAVVLRAIDLAAKSLATNPDDDDEGTDPSTDQDARWVRQDKRRADALVAMSESALQPASETCSSVPDRHQVVLYADVESLKKNPMEGPQLEDGRQVSVEAARRILCDAPVVELRTNDSGQPETSRKKRFPSTPMRRAVRARDRHCRFPGCRQKVAMDVHHVEHWIDDGETEPPNLALLCRYHHHLVHEGGFHMQAEVSGDFRFFTPDWKEIEPGYVCKVSGTLEELNTSIGLEIDGETGIPLWDGYPMDMDSAVVALTCIDDISDPSALLDWWKSEEGPGGQTAAAQGVSALE